MKHFAFNSLVLFVVVGSFYLMYMQNIDGTWNPPITFAVDQQRLRTDQQVYHPGDMVSIQNTFCKHRNYTAKTTWRLVNHTVIIFPDQGSRVSSTGCVTDKWFPIGIVPAYAIPGTHHLEATSALQINNLKTIYLTFQSEDFTVVK